MSVYEVGLRLDGRAVLVVGGGTIAGRRVPRLIDAGARVLVVAPEVTTTLSDLAASGELRWERREWRSGDGDDAWFVLAATNDPAVNAAVAAEAEARRTWCVRSDDAEASSAWTLARAAFDGVSVAVSASGDPRRAAAVRD
uniref:precorrin-2 dehydrogenase/sirohydrochlorin ferrochelatase family protein n=1 Tax=Glycomyces dulcitolivorans TaxID=2200759 RepID=UPI002FCDA675